MLCSTKKNWILTLLEHADKLLDCRVTCVHIDHVRMPPMSLGLCLEEGRGGGVKWAVLFGRSGLSGTNSKVIQK